MNLPLLVAEAAGKAGGVALVVTGAAALFAVVVVLTWALDLVSDRDLLIRLFDGARARERAAVRRAELAERRALTAESQLAALSTFDEEPPAMPLRRVA